MLADPQKQKLVYDLFLETIQEHLIMKSATFNEDGKPDSKTLERFQKEYNHSKNLIDSLNL